MGRTPFRFMDKRLALLGTRVLSESPKRNTGGTSFCRHGRRKGLKFRNSFCAAASPLDGFGVDICAIVRTGYFCPQMSLSGSRIVLEVLYKSRWGDSPFTSPIWASAPACA